MTVEESGVTVATVAVVIVSLLTVVGGLVTITMAMLCCKRQKTQRGSDRELDAEHQPWYIREQQQQLQQQQEEEKQQQKQQEQEQYIQHYVQEQQYIQDHYVQHHVQQQERESPAKAEGGEHMIHTHELHVNVHCMYKYSWQGSMN